MKFVSSIFTCLVSVIFTNAQINCGEINSNASNSPTGYYQLDIDGDGVKDFIFYVVYTSGVSATHYVIGKNGSEIEVDAPNGNLANKLSQGNQIGNNYWNDTAYLHISNPLSGNFNSPGYVGLRHYKNGGYYFAFVRITLTNGSSPFYTLLYEYGYNTQQGESLKAGQCSPTSVNDIEEKQAEIFYAEGTINVMLPVLTSPKMYSAEMINRLGQLVYSKKIFSGNNVVLLPNLQSGVYVTVIRDGANIVAHRKIWID